MQRRLLLLLAAFLSFSAATFAQLGTGTIKGTVIDGDIGGGVPFANVVLERNGNLVTGSATDIDGNFTIKSISPGKYDLVISYVGYQTIKLEGVEVNADRITILEEKQTTISAGQALEEVQVIGYKVPLIKKDGGSETTVTAEEIQKMPGRTATSVAVTTAGVYSQDGEVGSIRGSRSEATDTYIDGVKVRGSANLPMSALEQVTVVTGGLPAQYGDATGGVISITTKGPSRTYFGSAEVTSSQFLDDFGYNLAAFSLSGPLIMVKDKADTTKKKPLFGFFVSGEANYQKDPSPSAIGAFSVNDELLSYLEENPIRPSGLLTGGSFSNSEFVHKSDLIHTNYRNNVANQGINAAGKLDLNTSSNTNLTFGGSIDLQKRRIYAYSNALFNYDNNGEVIDNDWRVFGRFTQRFNAAQPKEGEKAPAISNAYYSIQADFTKENQLVQDPNHKDNLFKYGHVGQFTTHKINTYGFGIDTTTGLAGFLLNGFQDTLFAFEPSESNELLANYTEQFYAQNDREDNYENFSQVQQNGGLLNGQTPDRVYGLWSNTGTPYNSYSKTDREQYRITGTGSIDLKNHSFTLGFEYEQRVDRFVGYAPSGLWTLMRQYANNHIEQLDIANPHPVFDENGIFLDTVNYDRFYDADAQAFFDYSTREALGLSPDGLDWIDIDSYDPEMYDISFFSADELLNNGNNLVSYYGFDPYGNKLSGSPSFDDFFDATDEHGNKTRPVDAFRPIYVAGYLQDKFAFKDLIFNVGVRVDRYDANQKVLKDRFSLYTTRTAGEVTEIDGSAVQHPGNIGNDFVVYVNDAANPTAINGYRSGDTWYNASGQEITDPTVLAANSGIVTPYLTGSPGDEITADAFEDYTPQINVMPRISFSFPISEDALFFAHYDVLTKRPDVGNRLDMIDYFFLANRTNVVDNPNLLPEKTIDYEIGFQQKISQSSALKLSAFYREMRNMIQVINVTGAYPRSYTTYGNLDFGTVKGISATYDMRRTGNIQMRASYTLQFADGTGSNSTTGLNLINAGFANLRNIFPLNFDQRHNLVLTTDYRYGSGSDYNGPMLFGAQIFSNTGVNIIARAGSGTPYTRQSNALIAPSLSPTSGNGTTGVSGRSLIVGSINGSRLPWQFRVDVRLDKDIPLNFGKKDGKKKPGNLNVYLQVLNILNTKNVIAVYRKTGNPDDDGYLAAAEFQNEIASKNDEQAFRDLYSVFVNNPNNYSLPRRIRLGVLFSF